MLASTVQFSKNNQIPPHHCERRPNPLTRWFIRGREPITERHKKRVLSGPNSVPIRSPSPLMTFPRGRTAVLTHPATGRLASQHPLVSCPSVNTFGPRTWRVLLRKEVIQPHLPVRLPCYDFVPIASPTFDRSPHCWLGHGLRVLPTFVT